MRVSRLGRPRRTPSKPHLKWCCRCLVEKPKTEFYKNRHKWSGYHDYCKLCSRAEAEAWVKNNPEKRKKVVRANLLKKHYGLTIEDYELRALAQGGLCAICRKAPIFGVDHDHKTGQIRGLLCGPCNTVLGMAKDSVRILQAAIQYLETRR